MNYELLKKISKNLYINFQTLRNNIKDQDLNINMSFRATAEELMFQINNIYKFISEGEKFYNRIINNQSFQIHMLNNYGFDRKVMACLLNIQKEGNDTIHNKNKVFDVTLVKDYYYRLLLISNKILQKEYKNYDLNLSKQDIINEIDDLLKNKTKNTTPKDNFIEELDSYNNELITVFNNIKNNTETKIDEFIYKYKELIGYIINYIINYTNLNTIEDLKIGPYNELYKIYYSLENLLQYEEIDDVISNIYDYSLITRNILSNRFNIEILNWIEDIIDSNNDRTSEINNDYIEIAKAIDEVYAQEEIINNVENTVYYIEKQRPFYSNNNKYYAIELRKAINDNAKTRLVYSKYKLKDNYAMELSLTSKNIKLLDNTTQIYIITTYRVAIRPCEIVNLIYVLTGEKTNSIPKSGKFYQNLINYLETNQCTLLDIVTSKEETYTEFEKTFENISTSTCIFFKSAMKKARYIILKDEYLSGANLLKYFLSNLNNTVLKDQISKINKNNYFDNLFFKPGCLQFERNPFSYSLIKHTVNMKKLKKCFNVNDYADDIFIRKINDEMIEKQTLFIPYEQEDHDKINNIINVYNKNLYNDEGMKTIDNYIYKYQNVAIMKNIINIVKKESYKESANLYSQKLKEFLSNTKLDSKEKEEILLNAFNNSKISLIYGEAGSGKTELLCNYFTNIFKDLNILFLSNTHTCINNMERRVKEKCGLHNNFEFETIKSITNMIEANVNYTGEKYKVDVLIIDECKSISNKLIEKLLSNINFEYAIFAGDVGQIDAIELGNWYDIIKDFANPNSVYELKTNFRSNDLELINLWKKVRNHEEDTWEYMHKNNYIEKINSSVFEKNSENQIILCLNYGGIYGITSINSYFQNKNENKAYVNNIDTYKVDDPVIFNENANNKKYNHCLYNNLTGKIRDIQEDSDKLYFIIHVDTFISKDDLDCVITSNEKENWSNVKIELRKYKDNPEDNDEEAYKCPFDVTYATSIHKAQGLQFESVKIVITPESEDKLNNEIFYTAITRSTKQLKIYLTESKQQEIIDIISSKDDRVDSELLNKLMN